MSASEFENVLVDVRKAYRLIFLYQQRVLDLVKFIGDSLSLRFGGAWSWFGADAATSGTRVLLENSAWEWLNFYFYEFYFQLPPINGNNIQFSVIIQSDTGYFDDNSNNHLDIDSFSPVEKATTKLLFLVGKNCWYKDFQNEFNEDTNEMYKCDFAQVVKTKDNGILILKAFPLSRFTNLDETIKCLQEWIRLCNDNGIVEIKLKPGLLVN